MAGPATLAHPRRVKGQPPLSRRGNGPDYEGGAAPGRRGRDRTPRAPATGKTVAAGARRPAAWTPPPPWSWPRLDVLTSPEMIAKRWRPEGYWSSLKFPLPNSVNKRDVWVRKKRMARRLPPNQGIYKRRFVRKVTATRYRLCTACPVHHHLVLQHFHGRRHVEQVAEQLLRRRLPSFQPIRVASSRYSELRIDVICKSKSTFRRPWERGASGGRTARPRRCRSRSASAGRSDVGRAAARCCWSAAGWGPRGQVDHGDLPQDTRRSQEASRARPVRARRCGRRGSAPAGDAAASDAGRLKSAPASAASGIAAIRKLMPLVQLPGCARHRRSSNCESKTSSAGGWPVRSCRSRRAGTSAAFDHGDPGIGRAQDAG